MPLTPADLPPEWRRRVLEKASGPATPTRARRTAAAPQVARCSTCGAELVGEAAAVRHMEAEGHHHYEAVNE